MTQRNCFTRAAIFLFGLSALAAVVTLDASGAVTWTTSTQAEFLKGQAIGVSVDEIGRVAAAPEISVAYDAASPQIWSLAAGPGDSWVAGTGGDGRVLRSRAGQVATILDTTETNVYAVAVAPDGRVFAASGPDGKVYVIDAAGTSRVIFDPAEKYVWALVVDRSGRVWVGAGSPAVIYRIEADGTNKVIYKPSASHVVSLALDSTGRVLAGTEGPGRVYRFDAADRPAALFDSGLAEIRAITVAADGTIFAAALAGEGSGEGTGAAVSLGASAASSTTPAPSAPTRKSVIFRLPADGLPEPLWETSDIVYDVSVGDAGTVVAATGPDGHLFSIRPNGTDILINGVDARQVTRMARSSNRLLLATANPGRVQIVGSNLATPGTFLSAPRDAKTGARWGSIRWESVGPVALYTRTGNTDRPDESWSDWSGPYATPDGTAIQSPAARYLQWKAVFTPGAASVPASLTSVSVGYLPANARPVVTSITVHPPGAVFQKPFADDGAIAGLDDASAQQRRVAQGEPLPAAPALGRRMFQKGFQTFSWRADDTDADRLSYTLSYRREGETTWHELRAGWLDALIVWDTTSVPDGRYALKIAATDAASNTADRALAGERESAPFDIDNTPPVIAGVAIAAPGPAGDQRVTFTVRDAGTAIDHVEYSIAGGAFVPVSSIDGVADSREERYALTMPAGTDLTRVMLRATDVMQNVSTLSVGR
jgi:hypothetical protein